MRILRNIMLAGLVASLPFAMMACGDDDEETPGTGSAGSSTGGSSTGGSTTDGGSDAGGSDTGGTTSTDKEVVEVSANIEADITWTADKIYVLQNTVYVKGDATLTIEAGTTVKGAVGTTEPSALVITKSGMLMAKGTESEPIVFTSAADEGSRKAGDWGGLILLGTGPNFKGTENIEGLPEGADTEYGGGDSPDATHNCGTLEYVRVEFSGLDLGGGNEINGITFGSCGTDTVVSHVMVNQTLDDCFEWFGGGMDAQMLVCNGFGDDGLDIDQGFKGKITNALIRHNKPQTGDPNGLEWDSNSDNTDEPRTSAMLENATICGVTDNSETMYGGVLRENISGGLKTVEILGFTSAFDLRDNASGGDDISLEGVNYFGLGGSDDFGTGGETTIDVSAWFGTCTDCGKVDPGYSVEDCLGASGPADSVKTSGKGGYTASATWTDGAWVSWAEN